MADINHYFGGDLTTSATGDLNSADGITMSQQRILRRLLTNPGDYLWQPDFGAGLPSYIGVALNLPAKQKINSLIKSQILLESSVASTPAPVITLQAQPQGLFCQIEYTDAPSTTQQILAFNVSA